MGLLATQAIQAGMNGSDALKVVLALLFVGWLLSPNKSKKNGKGKVHPSKRKARRVPVASHSGKKRRKKFGS